MICGEGGLVQNGGTASVAIDYYVLGYRAGEMAYEILVNGADVSTMEIQYAPFQKEYNPEIADKLGIIVPEDYGAVE